ncbi:MAG: hypothetical protein IIT54_00620 [Acetobacter sp.]|nr:hypothetical protein [Acetobacter sp.]
MTTNWKETTTTRIVSEDEVPPHIRKIMQRGDEEEFEELVENLMEVIGGTLEYVGEALGSADEIEEISNKIEDDIPPRILRTLRLEVFKIIENMLSAGIPLAIIVEGGETEQTKELKELLSKVRKNRKALED